MANPIIGTEGNDTLVGGSGAETITGLAGDDTITGNGGADSIDAGTGNDTVTGDGGADTIIGGGGRDSVLGGAGNDTIYVGSGPNASSVEASGYYDGGADNDTIISSGSGLDATILGGSGNDTITIGNIGGTMAVNAGGAKLVDGGEGDDTITVFIANGFTGSILGGSGTDTFVLRAGYEPMVSVTTSLRQVSGFETIDLSFTSLPSNQTIKLYDENLVGGTLTVLLASGGAASGSIVDASEVVSGGVRFQTPPNTLPGPGMIAVDTVIGGQGNDTLDTGSGSDKLDGQGGNDSILAGTGDDTVTGGAGNDTINGGDGSDTAVYSGNAADYTITQLTYNSFQIVDTRGGSPDGTDVIIDVNKLKFNDQTIDVVLGGILVTSGNPITGTEGNDTLVGGSGAETITGLAGDDTITGNGGADSIDAGTGNDTVTGDGGADTIIGGGGRDSVLGGAGNDTIYVGSGPNASSVEASGYYDGGADNDTIISSGSGLDATILGGSGNDTITIGNIGGTMAVNAGGAKLVDGGEGDDTITVFIANGFTGSILGGSGTDTFVLRAGYEPMVSVTTSLRQVSGFETIDLSFTSLPSNQTIKLYDENLVGGTLTVLLASGGAASGSIVDASEVVSGGVRFQTPPNTLPGPGMIAVDTVIGGQGNDTLDTGSGSDKLDGQGGNDSILAGTGDDTVTGGAGNDTINGGDGSDTAVYSGNAADYTITQLTYNSFQIVDTRGGSPDGTDVIIDVNKLKFNDQTIDVVLGGILVTSGNPITGTEGNDTLVGGSGAETITGLAGDDTITGNGGADSIDAGTGNDTVTGDGGADTIIGGGGRDSVLGGAGNDTIYVGSGPNASSVEASGYYDGGADNDTIISSGSGLDATILGGSGNDTITIGNIGGTMAVNAGGAKLVDGGEGDDTITVFIANGFTGSILGGSGTDTFVLRAGYEPMVSVTTSLRQVSGFETIDLSFTSLPSNQTIKLYDENLVGGTLTVLLASGGAASGSIVDASEVVSGGVRFQTPPNTLPGPGMIAVDTVIGGQGNDTLDTGSGSDKLDGQGGNDSILAGTGDNTVTGGAGNDTINGGDGSDTAVYSGNAADYTITQLTYNSFQIVDTRGGSPDGTDVIIDVNKLKFNDQTQNVVITGIEIIGTDDDESFSGGANADHIDGVGGDDTVQGAGGHDWLAGGSGGDSLNGGSGNDSVEGGSGGDTLVGGAGSDTLIGGSGGDTYVLDDESDVVIEPAGGAAARSSAGAKVEVDTIVSSISRSLAAFAGIENLKLTGKAKNGTGNELANALTGNAKANKLDGGAGADTLAGGAGNDSLTGGASKDLLSGAAGKDKFVFLAIADLGKTAGKRDVISDFKHGQDKIDLSGLDAIGRTGKNDAFKLLADEGAKFTKHAGQLRFDEQGSGSHKITVIEGDINGDGKADFQIELSGWVHLVKGDFVL